MRIHQRMVVFVRIAVVALPITLWGCTTMPFKSTGHADYSCGETPAGAEFGLALSGGGYRAMLYHTGVLWRLHELGLLSKMDIIASVSGGSITAAHLALNWDQLQDGGNFSSLIADPLLRLNDRSIDVASVLVGMLPVTSASARVAKKYSKYLYGDKTLQAFPDPATGAPVFSVLSTNLRTGKLAKFRRNCFYHYPTGYVPHPDIPVATAVASSTAFPPFLSPNSVDFDSNSVLRIDRDSEDNDPDLYDQGSYRYSYKLTDGGVYDNLGIEDINGKSIKHLFVSDAGAPYRPRKRIFSNWVIQMVHVTGAIDSQVRAHRIKELNQLLKEKKGAYWQIHTTQDTYTKKKQIDVGHPYTDQQVDRLSRISTRLSPMDNPRQLINWGYTSTDNSLQSFYDDISAYNAPFNLPYPEAE